MSPQITAHMLVKNEDCWVGFAVQSVLPYVDVFHIIDTGSTDHTIELIKSIPSPKIRLEIKPTSSAEGISALRQYQLEITSTPWFWLVDGDEIYPRRTAEEVVAATGKKYEGVAVRRYDLLGDVYHRQREAIGEYQLFGQRGHLVSRLFNRRLLPGLNVKGVYPLEGYFDRDGIITQAHSSKYWYVSENYLFHAMYLQRSTNGKNLGNVFNRSKYKIETGLPIFSPLPEVFDLPRPSFIPDPKRRRGLAYELAAGIITPVKNLQRKLR